MDTNRKLSKIYSSSKAVTINDNSRIVLMSDCHRSDGSWADSLSRNQNVYNAALEHYLQGGYTYIEIGDGDELWKNYDYSKVVEAHKDSLWLLAKFNDAKRLYMIYGNHDIVKKHTNFIQNNMHHYFDTRLKAYIPLLKNLKVYEGLILRHAETGRDIFLVHGHQVDRINSVLWRLSRFLVHNLWTPLEALGVNDPTSPAKNYKKSTQVEERLTSWSLKEDRMIVAGHTHRPVFPDKGRALYFNDGSCVHPRCTSAIEIFEGSIMLVKWCIGVKEDGILFVKREIIAGPEKLSAYLDTKAKKQKGS